MCVAPHLARQICAICSIENGGRIKRFEPCKAGGGRSCDLLTRFLPVCPINPQLPCQASAAWHALPSTVTVFSSTVIISYRKYARLLDLFVVWVGHAKRYFRQDLDKKMQYWISFRNRAHVDILTCISWRASILVFNGDLPAYFDPSAASASSPLIRSDNCEVLSRPPHRPAACAECWSAACRWHLQTS